jgi:diguanylate cyclase (GGDEF)-like protein/PAS domain S-box-containing protein
VHGRPHVPFPGNRIGDLKGDMATLSNLLKTLADGQTSFTIPDDCECREELRQLTEYLDDITGYARAMAGGDLSISLRQHGPLPSALKALQASLRHLTWQTKEVAAGDFSQRVDFLGDFSSAFNHMVEALAVARDDLTTKNQELSESEARFRAIIETLPIPYALVDDRQNIAYVNEAFVNSFGYTLDDVPTLDEFWRRVYPNSEHRQWMTTIWGAHLENLRDMPRTFEPVETEVLCRNGNTRTVLIGSAFLSKSLHGSHGISLVDITARKKAEDEQRLAATVFSHAKEGIMITDVGGAILDVNETFCQITGYSREEVLGKNPRLLSSGRQNNAFYSAMWLDLIKNGQWSGEVWNRRKDGLIYAEMLTISAVPCAFGNTAQYVALFSDITELKEHEKQLEHIAHFDALTNLPNRILLSDRIRQTMAFALRHRCRIAVAFLDLDGFKAINDKYGHGTGDKLLVVLAGRLKKSLRESDTVARLGGDEFVAVLSDLGNDEAYVIVLDRLLAAVCEPVVIDDIDHQVSASIGVTFFPQPGETDADLLLRQADQAMYQAKRGGKNRFSVYHPE